MTYANALLDECLCCTGVPVLEPDVPSSLARFKEPPGPSLLLPLLLRDWSKVDGARLMLWVELRFADPLRRRRSSIPTWVEDWWP